MSHEQVVSFRHNSWQVAATLRLPEGFDANQKYPAIVCAHPISSCKEQTSGAVYGQKLTEAGFITLAFDASTRGESGGEPRFSENPSTRVEDFRCAMNYLVTLAYVDEDRIGVLGVCGGGGYAVSAATIDHRFKAVATVVAANYGRIMREGIPVRMPRSERLTRWVNNVLLKLGEPLLLLSVIFLTMQKRWRMRTSTISTSLRQLITTRPRAGKSRARLTNCDLPAPHRP